MSHFSPLSDAPSELALPPADGISTLTTEFLGHNTMAEDLVYNTPAVSDVTLYNRAEKHLDVLQHEPFTCHNTPEWSR